MTPQEKILKAKTALLMDYPFFGSIACKWQYEQDATIETGACNSKRLRYNPAWIDGLSLPKVKGFIAHEVLHIANGHHLRRADRDKEHWNAACDYAINPVLIKNGLDLPDGYLDGFGDSSAEEIYSEIYQKKPDPDGDPEPSGDGQQGDGNDGPGDDTGDGDGDSPPDPGRCGAVEDLEGEDGEQLSPAELKQAETDNRVDLAQATQIARNMGLEPAGMTGLIEDILYPKLDFESLLQRFVQRSARDNYSWSPPNRRFISLDIYLPSLRSDSIELIIAVDTSGSTLGDLDLFCGSVNAILATFSRVKVTVLYCDAAIQGDPVEFSENDLPVKIEFRGGGGTSFRPVFEYVEQENLDPDCLIYLTDMYGSFPDRAPDYPTLWACVTDEIAPFGETVKLE
jgi:predicted metal-dependent peptidase